MDHDDDIDAPGDRDGVVNRGVGYLIEISKSKWIEGAREARQTRECARLPIRRRPRAFMRKATCTPSALDGGGARRSGRAYRCIEYCPEYPQALVERYRRDSDRRKHGPGMIIDLIKRFPVAADRSLLIGEQERNTEAAHAAGIRGLLFRDGNLASFVRDALKLA